MIQLYWVYHQNLDYLIDPIFQGVNRRFVLPLVDNAHQTSYKQHFLPTVEIKDYKVMINGKTFFDQPVWNNLRTYYSIQKNQEVKAMIT